MTKENPYLITVPLEFKVACALCKINIESALQIFINHCSLYDSLTAGYKKYYAEAAETVSQYIELKRPGTNMVINDSAEVQHCLLAMVHEGVKHKGDQIIGRKKANKHVTQLLKATKREYHPKSRSIYLDKDTVLHLSKDFCAMCELYACYPPEILEYYMSMISLADATAANDLKIKTNNYSMYFFTESTSKYIQKYKDFLEITQEDHDFLQELTEYRLELYIIRNVFQRKARLKEFYHSYYQKIINSNPSRYATW